MRNNITLIILFTLLIFSCTPEINIKKHYHSSGNLKQISFYDSKGNIDSLKSYYDSTKITNYIKNFRKKKYDSVVFYYKNGNIFKMGKQTFEGLKFGNWIRYTKEGYKSDIREYFIVKGENIINRRFYLNRKGDTTWYGRKFNTYDQIEFRKDTTDSRNSIMVSFNFYHGDTINLNEPFAANVICGSPLMRKHNSEIMMLLAKENNNYNNTFSNENEVKLDTFKNIKFDKNNIDNFTGEDKQYVAVFGRWFKTSGEKTLRGYMKEYATFLNENGDTLKGERKVYFEKKIYVKDTINPDRPDRADL